VNAVERFWRAVRREDWASAEQQLHDHVVVRHPHSGARYDRAWQYLDVHKLDRDRTSVDVREVVSEGKHVAVLVVVGHRDGPDWHCSAFYELQEGRIAHATEVWVPDASGPALTE
jgi:ketosteroid isomerase-like protein